MTAKLADYEWQYLLQLVSRIYCGRSFKAVCLTTMEQLKTLIPFQQGICFETRRQNGRPVLRRPVTLPDHAEHSLDAFFQGDYPRWSEFIMAPSSMIFRQSDLIPESRSWEKSRVYRSLWQPRGIYYGLFLSVVYHDHPQALLGLFRTRETGDFSDRDGFILQQLSDALEHRLCRLSEEYVKTDPSLTSRAAREKSARYSLTRRETEIVSFLTAGWDTPAICLRLCISVSTLNKHISNIYSKTGAHTRTQLYSLFISP